MFLNKKIKILCIFGAICSFVCSFSRAQTINFVSPTLPDQTVSINPYFSAGVEVSNISNISGFLWNRNGQSFVCNNIMYMPAGYNSCTNYGDTGLVLAMNFDKLIEYGETDAFIRDRSNYGNNGTGMNTPIWTGNGKFGGAYQFNGNNNFIEVANNALLNITGNITMSVRFKTSTEQSTYPMLLGKIGTYPDPVSSTNAPGYGILIVPPNKISCQILKHHNTQMAQIRSPTSVVDGKRHSVACTYDGSLFKLYLDNVLVAQTNYNLGMMPSSSNLYIGRDVRGGTPQTVSFSGLIDDVRLYNRALTSGEIYKNYVSTVKKYGVDDNLVLKMNFDNILSAGETTGGIVKDRSRYGNNGSGYGGVMWTGNGKFGGAYEFDGVNDYVGIAHSSSLDSTGNFSIFLWIKQNSVGGRLIDKLLAGSIGGSFMLDTYGLGDGRRLRFCTTTSCVSANTSYTLSARHFVGITLSNTGYYQFYLDNNLDGAGGYITVTSSILDIYLGNAHGSDYFYHGLIDDLRIYNRALTSGEVSDLYNSTRRYHFSNTHTGLATGTYVYSLNVIDTGNVLYTGSTGSYIVYDGNIKSYFMVNPANAWYGVNLSNNIFSNAWKTSWGLTAGTSYDLIFNFVNDLRRDTMSTDKLETPFKFKLPVPVGVKNGEAASVPMKVKFLTSP